jgi:glycosyltransferase involved in cell wall biosynthesis
MTTTPRRLRIAQIAPPWITVPPAGYGGTEWVVQQLCDGLTDAGHEVVLYATGDSNTAAELRALFPVQMPQVMGQSAYDARHVRFALQDILAADPPFDLVHDHSGFLVVAFGPAELARGPRPAPPILHTIHCAFDEAAYGFYAQHARAVHYNAISDYQRSMGPPDMRWAGVVHNAMELEGWRYTPRKDDYLLAFGRVCEAKGFHVAIDVARRTGRRLLMAGALQAQYEDYFRALIEPQLDDQIVYLGEVTDERRRELFAGAAAFLFPILWPEPFGLVMIEAMACGTPVVAFRNGSVPEVIDDGVNGFIVADADGMVAALDHLGAIDPAVCRRSVEERFSVARLVSDYATIYRRLLEEGGPR